MHDTLFQFISNYITLTDEEKAAIVSQNIFKSVRKNTVLLEAGTRSSNQFFVLKGCLRSYYIIEGEEKTTAFYTELEGITPPGAATGEECPFYLAAVEDSLITISDPSMEVEMFEKFPRFETLCRMLAEELLAKERMSADQFKTQSPEQRYQQLISSRPDLVQRVPQHQLASFIGITPQSLSRLRNRIKHKKG